MSTISLFSWNVNGIRAVLRKEALQQFITTYSPDILCLQETKAEKQELPIDFAEYKEFWNSATRKGYSGTAIFSKTEPIAVTPNLPEDIADAFGLLHDGYGHPNEEGRLITAEFPSFFVVNSYTPNSKDDLSRVPLRQKWDPACLAYCKKLMDRKPVIYCGDFNVAHTPLDLSRPKENEGKKGFTREEREGFDAYVKSGLIDTLRLFHAEGELYTWWAPWGGARDRNVGWRIDYILASSQLKDNIKSADIHPEILGSDHCPVSINLIAER